MFGIVNSLGEGDQKQLTPVNNGVTESYESTALKDSIVKLLHSDIISKIFRNSERGSAWKFHNFQYMSLIIVEKRYKDIEMFFGGKKKKNLQSQIDNEASASPLSEVSGDEEPTHSILLESEARSEEEDPTESDLSLIHI